MDRLVRTLGQVLRVKSSLPSTACTALYDLAPAKLTTSFLPSWDMHSQLSNGQLVGQGDLH